MRSMSTEALRQSTGGSQRRAERADGGVRCVCQSGSAQD